MIMMSHGHFVRSLIALMGALNVSYGLALTEITSFGQAAHHRLTDAHGALTGS
jgi:hypothetical protein